MDVAMHKPYDPLWFSDGNVVLATNTLMFKLHKGVLAIQSSVFKDMFEYSAGQEEGKTLELYEGLPLVTMVGDEGKDVVHLLRAAYERHYFRRDKESTLEVVAALLPLATKYDFKEIRADVIAHISSFYPTTLTEADETEDRLMLSGATREECHLTLLKAAYAADADVLLPAIYYACAGYPVRTILASAHLLGHDCVSTLLDGRETLLRTINRVIMTLPSKSFANPHGECCSSKYGENCLEEIRFNGLEDFSNATKLTSIRGRDLVKKSIYELCKDCRAVVDGIVEDERRIIWNAVPSYFGFPGWSAIRAKMEEFS